ncbi:MAG: electron transport complex subunit RsxG [Rhodobacterales bacterium]|nr:electron transport complex subunit RsxG [Rhodobacterales bacterium]
MTGQLPIAALPPVAARRARIGLKRGRRGARRAWRKVGTAATGPLRAVKGSPGLHGLLLALFALACTGLLAAADRGMRAEIAQRAADDLQASLSQVVPDALHDNDLSTARATLRDPAEGPVEVYRAHKGGAVVGVAFQMIAKGYGGDIRLLLGVDADGRLLGVRVLSHAETPGLGDKIETAKSGWALGFDGLSLGNPPVDRWKVKKDGGRFDQFSGATITPRAVVAAVRRGLEFFARQKAVILAPVTGKGPS